jgi:hypothetical protein
MSFAGIEADAALKRNPIRDLMTRQSQMRPGLQVAEP